MGKLKFTPVYTTYDNVKVRLTNKVQFQQDPDNLQEGEVPDDFLGQQICDAETLVEQKLRKRYAIPFQSIRTGRYMDLPDHSKRALRVACDLQAVLLIIENDFGRGTHIDADAMKKNMQERYDDAIADLLGHDLEGKDGKEKRFRNSPPLEDVKLAFSNSKADDGFKGMLINTDGGRNESDYAAGQINDPSRSYITALPGSNFE